MMRAIEQIAIKSQDIAASIRDIGLISTFGRTIADGQHQTDWVRDIVVATHIFTGPSNPLALIGQNFKVALAFNYDFISSRETELIQLLAGHTVQMGGSAFGLSHFGYHIPDGASLFEELQWWKSHGIYCHQISATVMHQNTQRRYLYAFVNTRESIGVYTKVILRVPGIRRIEELIQEFEHVNA